MTTNLLDELSKYQGIGQMSDDVKRRVTDLCTTIPNWLELSCRPWCWLIGMRMRRKQFNALIIAPLVVIVEPILTGSKLAMIGCPVAAACLDAC